MLSELLMRLAGTESAFDKVYANNGVEAMITCAVEPKSAITPYVLFPQEVVRWAADNNVAIAVDLMLWRDDASNG